MNQPIHVCIVTTAHPTDDVRVKNKFADTFLNAGFRVSWVGPGHNYFDASQPDTSDIEFTLAPANRNRLDRVTAVRRIRKLARSVDDVDVYYAPEPDSAQLALRLAKGTAAKVVFDIHEVFHGPLLDRWLFNRKLQPIRNAVQRRIANVCARVDLTLGVSDAVLDCYVSQKSPYQVVRSCAPSWFAEGASADVCGAGRDQLTLMHGKAMLQRGSLEVLEAVRQASQTVVGLNVLMFENQPAGTRNAEAETLVRKAAEFANAATLDLRAGVPMQQMPSILRSCDVGLIAYGRNLGIDSLPNRLFEYMAVGLPIIAPHYAVEIAKIVRAEKCGLLVDFEDPTSIAEAIVQLRQDPQQCREMGQRSRAAFLARHNCEAEMQPLISTIRNWFDDRVERVNGKTIATSRAA